MNISLNNKNFLLVKDGVIEDITKSLKIPSTQNTLKIGFFTSTPDSRYSLDLPVLSYDENVLESMLADDLKLGGEITSNPRYLNIILICKPNKKEISDFQIVVKDSITKEAIGIDFQKECDTISGIEEYFAFLKFVYWIMMIFVIVFAFSTVTYFLNRNGMTFGEFIKSSIRNFMIKINDIKEYVNNGYTSMRHMSGMSKKYESRDSYDDGILRDEGLNDGSSMTTKRNSDNNTYGGI